MVVTRLRMYTSVSWMQAQFRQNSLPMKIRAVSWAISGAWILIGCHPILSLC
ncbi:hypothetical protein BJX70DRAFT_383948 [Aspergillus crustosus]